MIHGLQLIIHFPMLHIHAPGNLGMMQEQLINIATFDLIPFNDILANFVDL